MHQESYIRFSEDDDEDCVRIRVHQDKPLLEPPFQQAPQQLQRPYIERQYQEQEDSKDKKDRKDKRGSKKKHIEKKDEKKGKKKEYKKRVKDQTITVAMGRPDNKGPQAQHLKENKSYNDIVYHFSRFLIFLKLMQGDNKSMHDGMELTYEQGQCIRRAQQIMAQDNYPAYEDAKPNFLLHPNSPHFVLFYETQNQDKREYRSEEIQSIMIAYLKKKGLLTTDTYRYLLDYWHDIIVLVNNPKGVETDDIPNDDSDVSGEVVEMPNDENIDTNKKSESSNKKQTISEYTILKSQLDEDPTIAAYQIACYLHACCKKYQIAIIQ